VPITFNPYVILHISISTAASCDRKVYCFAVAEKGGHSAISMVLSFTTGQPFCSSLVEALHRLDWNEVDSFFIQLSSPLKQKVHRTSIPPCSMPSHLQYAITPTISVVSNYCAFIHSTISDEYWTWPWYGSRHIMANNLFLFHNACCIHVIRLSLTLQLLSYYWIPYRTILVEIMHVAINCQGGRTRCSHQTSQGATINTYRGQLTWYTE